MKVFLSFHRLAPVALAWMLAGSPANGQIVGLSVSNPPTQVPISSTFTYTVTITNTGAANQDVFVTNAISGPALITTAAPTFAVGLLFSLNSTNATFEIFPFLFGQIAQFAVTVQATGAGFVSNTISVGAPFSVLTNVFITNVVTEVTNVAPTITNADLAVSLTGPAPAVITNDYVTYGVTVSNLGPGDATGIQLTNSLPPNTAFINLTPASLVPTLDGTNVILNLGTLSTSTVALLSLRVQPTNAGPLTLLASVGGTSTDPNPTNNTATTNIFVTNYLSRLAVSNISAQSLNLQDGWMEQTIELWNTGTSTIASARVVVSGLGATNWLVNTVGTNSGLPFVTYANTLDPGRNVSLRLQYFVFDRLPFAMNDNQFQAFEVPPVNVAAPAVVAGTPVAVTNPVVQLPSGDFLIEFPSESGRDYTVFYYDNGDTNNIRVAQPTVKAQANWVQWIDYGPPATTSHPTNLTTRSYLVFQNP